MANNIVNEKKKALIARKEKLLEDIQYYEKRISDFHANKSAASFFEDDCSSDSDTELPIKDKGPSVKHLESQRSQLKTSLHATQELTNLLLLESEVNLMVTDPVIADEPEVSEPGVWREVIAECKLDLVPFSLTFNVHTPSRKFGAPSFRNLKVILSKAAHETELAKSVLSHARTPSDAVEVLRSYSVAHRSRRTTLARLTEKYPSLFMEPLAEGGYILKCADLLEVRWILQNKWSSIAPFHHRMVFDIEYMDESYIKTITQYHRQLSDPTIETDDRTALLSKIINTCLEAKGPTQELYESMESDDPETAQTLRKRRTTLDQEVTETAHKKKRDDAIMAPPKSLPKKSKAKGKENVEKVGNDVNRESYASFKDGISSKSNRKESVRSNKDERVDSVVSAESRQSNNVEKNGTKERDVVSAKSKDSKKEAKTAKEADGRKEDGKTRKESVAKSAKENNDARKDTQKSTKEDFTENTEARKESVQKSAKDKNNKKDSAKPSKENPSDATKVNQVKENDNVTNNLKEKNVKATKVNEDGNSKDNASSKVPKKLTAGKNIEGNKNHGKIAKKVVDPKSKVNANKEKVQKDKQMDTDEGEIAETVNDKQDSDKGNTIKSKADGNANKNTDANKINNNKLKNAPKKSKKTDDIANVPVKKAKIDQTAKNAPAAVKTTEKPKKSVNNINKADKNPHKVNSVQATDKNDAKSTDNAQIKDNTYTKINETLEKVTENHKIVTAKAHVTNVAKINGKNLSKNLNNIQKAKNSQNNMKDKLKSNIENNKNVNNDRFKKISSGNTKFSVKRLSAGNTVKETSTESRTSKIPQKLTKVASSSMKNPLRISPRKFSLAAKSAQAVKKTIQKPMTSIPRLLKKPVSKT